MPITIWIRVRKGGQGFHLPWKSGTEAISVSVLLGDKISCDYSPCLCATVRIRKNQAVQTLAKTLSAVFALVLGKVAHVIRLFDVTVAVQH